MKHIINQKTGDVLGATLIEIELQEDEVLVDEKQEVWYLKPKFDFKTREFYEGATQEELDEFNNQQAENENIVT